MSTKKPTSKQTKPSKGAKTLAKANKRTFSFLFHVKARRGKETALIKFLRRDRRESLGNEPGTLSFDIYRDPHDPAAFFVYEAYVSRAAFAKHRQGHAYQKWKSVAFKKSVVCSHYDLERL